MLHFESSPTTLITRLLQWNNYYNTWNILVIDGDPLSQRHACLPLVTLDIEDLILITGKLSAITDDGTIQYWMVQPNEAESYWSIRISNNLRLIGRDMSANGSGRK
jgi:hypothetical protein